MSVKKITSLGGLVYSTDPNFKLDENGEQEKETLLPKDQKLKISLDKKHRAGKAVTLITNFVGTQEDREALGKKLKSFCGTGGAVKDGDIIVQGDNRDKVMVWLQKNEFSASKKI
jgi:translation initiation factor 1